MSNGEKYFGKYRGLVLNNVDPIADGQAHGAGAGRDRNCAGDLGDAMCAHRGHSEWAWWRFR